MHEKIQESLGFHLPKRVGPVLFLFLREGRVSYLTSIKSFNARQCENSEDKISSIRPKVGLMWVDVRARR